MIERCSMKSVKTEDKNNETDKLNKKIHIPNKKYIIQSTFPMPYWYHFKKKKNPRFPTRNKMFKVFKKRKKADWIVIPNKLKHFLRNLEYFIYKSCFENWEIWSTRVMEKSGWRFVYHALHIAYPPVDATHSPPLPFHLYIFHSLVYSHLLLLYIKTIPPCTLTINHFNFGF